MANIPMSKEILDVINAVVTYGRWIRSHDYVVKTEHSDDHIVAMEKYYHSLPLPNEMSKNRADFEKILQLGWYSGKELQRLNSINETDLCHIPWKPTDFSGQLDKTIANAKNRSTVSSLNEPKRKLEIDKE